MLDCVSIGDSIATFPGLGNALHCSEVRAKKGVPSSFIIREAKISGSHDVCVISAGSNDSLNLNLEKNLENIRNNVKCKIIVWVKPANHRASNVVNNVANRHNDLSVQVVPGRDHVHPYSYKNLAYKIEKIIKGK